MSTFHIPPELRSKHFVIAICAPENFVHSNGITVLLNAALTLQSLGLRVGVVPSTSTTQTYSYLAAPYDDLSILWEVPHGCSVILGDTVSRERLEEIRARAAQICHYTMAPNGLFGDGDPWGNRTLLLPGEKQAVYSPHISTKLPYFYLQTHFPDLEPWIEKTSQHTPTIPPTNRRRPLKACIYPGKGHMQLAPRELRTRIERSRSCLIRRFYPTTKAALYNELATSDLLISYDPITSLAFEASLLGIPVYIPLGWDEVEYKGSFPVDLSGIILNDLPKFLEVLDSGLDQKPIVDSYRAALANNTHNLLRLLSFAFTDSGDHKTSKEINAYWDTRQPFFASLNLPSVAGWETMKEALPATTVPELIHDVLEFSGRQIGRFNRMLVSRWRGARRRVRALLSSEAD